VWVWLNSHSCEISSVLAPQIYPTSGIRADGLWLGRVQFVIKVLVLEGECTNVEETLT